MPGFRLPMDIHDLPILVSRPAEGDLSSPFGYRRDPIRKRRRKFHRGIDFHGKRGHPVYAAGPGVVTRARRNGGYGRVVYIDHGLGLETRYAHLHRIHVEEGDFVPAGTLVGRIGSTGRSTGPHLHFEVRRNGRAINPDLAMDVTLFGDGGLVGTLATLLNPRQWVEPPRTKRKKRRSKPKRRPRSRRVKNLW
ncbi:MAG: M23 family metallopeptidase [Deltaproteobacteria bacterium]|nr:M23 family metallopeptidase [Deltaproteobacteria bacterium]